MLQENCCENCRYARKTDIDGLIDCEKDGRSKDADMVCEDYKNVSISHYKETVGYGYSEEEIDRVEVTVNLPMSEQR